MRKQSTSVIEAKQNLEKLAHELEAFDRGPFRKMLAGLLGVQPTRAALQRFANRSPDRWAQALSVLGVLAGYERGASVEINLYSVKHLSDAELLREAAERGVRIIDGEAVTVTEGTTTTDSGPMEAAEAAIDGMTDKVTISSLPIVPNG